MTAVVRNNTGVGRSYLPVREEIRYWLLTTCIGNKEGSSNLLQGS